MKKSGFQLVNERVLSLDYKINENSEIGNIDLKLLGNTQIDKLSDNKARVLFNFCVFKDEPIESVPFKIDIVIEGIFTWNDEIPVDKIDQLLSSNAPAILISYIRSIISQLTVLSGFPALVIPLLNFTK